MTTDQWRVSMMKRILKIKDAILNELRRQSVWDSGWRIVLLAGLITLASTMLILLAKELI